MKINVLRRLLVFGVFLFLLLSLLVTGSSLFLQAPVWHQPYFATVLFGFYLGLLSYTAYTFFKAGIWIAHSLPSAIKYNKWPWIRWAIAGAALATATYILGKMPWMPLVWQGFAIPVIFSISVFLFIWGLIAPILSWSSNIQFSRLTAFVIIAPLMALLPLTSFFVSQSLVTSYFKSFPGTYKYVVDSIPELDDQADLPEVAAQAPLFTDASYEVADNLKVIKQAVLTGNACSEKKKEIYNLLEKTTPEEQLFWAIKGVRCAGLSSAVSFPKLVKIMVEHQGSTIRAAAIHAIARYAPEAIKNVSYLIVKRIQEKESPEVIEAAALVLKKLGGNDEKYATSRLKSLLASKHSVTIGKLLLTQFQNNSQNDSQGKDEVYDFVESNLALNSSNRHYAIDLICDLPKESTANLSGKVDVIIKDLGSQTRKDQTMKALACLGDTAFQAIRNEVIEPKQLDRVVAIKAFSKIKSQFGGAYLETLKTCVGDQRLDIRRWCAKSIGQVGAPALPMILDLLKAESPTLKETGQIALAHLNDPSVIEELESLRDKNSGWLANQQNLKIAESIQIALAKIEQTTKNQ